MYKLSNIQMVRGGRSILEVDSLQIPTSELTVVLGHNGSGKSTLVSLLSGQQAPDSGLVELNGHSLTGYKTKDLAKQVAFLPQKLPTSAGLTVKELVKLGRFPWRGTLGRWNAEDSHIIDESIAKTGVEAFAHTLADELSGGERQRAWVAMLLAQQSPILILDEPTSALDIQHQYQLMNLLAELNQTQHVGVIVILHDLNLALRYATHIVALKNGKIAFEGQSNILLDEQRLSDLYESTIRLIDHPEPSKKNGNNKVAIVCA
ncbi:ABC transporter [Photobacterium frigidiphilum]|uniref:ABC transporter n=1 Tax=Photobacterium frigidiphilum TaxID=264736 RepID=A0A2T3JM84_9GAMM|nr:ABC transporter ATP-binding protein [Photobacterium frigidiphilum]PSU50108.1 ABC transporter [Photobacterium frigidiphilum]